jgi:hypothetical protein
VDKQPSQSRTGMPIDPPCTREIAIYRLIEDGEGLLVAEP